MFADLMSDHITWRFWFVAVLDFQCGRFGLTCGRFGRNSFIMASPILLGGENIKITSNTRMCRK